MINTKKEKFTFEDLLEILNILRGDNGCPWDKVQTHESIKGNTLEEAYEVVEAIDNKDVENLKEELGDLLLHVVFHSKIAEDNNEFNIAHVIDGISKKLIRRHPHVFAETQVENVDEVNKNWEEIKKTEKNNKTIVDEIDDVPNALPALTKAYKVQKKAARIGFDFEDVSEALGKMKEEITELEVAIESANNREIDVEYGDLLFSIVNVSRFLGLNPEISLTNATKKFINRFKGIHQLASENNTSLENLSVNDMNSLWEKYKNDSSNQL